METTTTTKASDGSTITTNLVSAEPVKPGWQTTEFCGAWAVKILGALIAGGVFGDGTTAMRIAGAAMTLLGFLGYTYSRTLVKAAVFVLMLCLGTSTMTACASSAQVGAGNAVIDCTRADAPALEELLGVTSIRLRDGTVQ